MASYVTPLHVAAGQGGVDEVRELLEYGKYSVNSIDSLGRSPLYHACANGHLNVVRVLVSGYKADMTIQDASGITALNMAAKCGHESIVCALLEEYGCPVDAKDNTGQTVLHYACRGGSVSLVQTLIRKYKADVNARNGTNATPLCVAAANGKLEVVLCLIDEFGCDPNVKGYIGRSLLHYACTSGIVSLVQTLIQRYKADLNARDNRNATPLCVAALAGKLEVVLCLIDEFGCDSNVKGYIGRSLLHYACTSGIVSLVQTLIQRYKADLNARDNRNATPLCVAALAGKLEVVLCLIDEFGCDSNVKGYIGRSLLHYACTSGSVSLVQTLIQRYKADLNARDNRNATPLCVAALAGKLEVVLCLIDEFGCDSNVKGYIGRSLLHYACTSGIVSLVQTLIQRYKADLNARDNRNATPLCVAALAGKLEVVLCLIDEFGCDSNVKGYIGRSLLHYACTSGSVSLVQTLIQRYKADVNARDDQNVTPLFIAASAGESEAALYLISELGYDPNVKGHVGRSLLHNACAGGNITLVQTLIRKHKADISARDDNFSTPLCMAALAGKAKIVLCLISEFGCDPNVRGYAGRTLLHDACAGGNVSLVQTLIREYKADVNDRDDLNDTPLCIAALAGKLEVVLSLISEFGCDPNVRGRVGRPLLHYACLGGNVSLVQTLIRNHKADINAQDGENHTPLCVAATSGNLSVVRVLLSEFKADMSFQTPDGVTALMLAAKHGHGNVVHALLSDYQCPVNGKNKDGYTALHYSCRYGHVDILRTLINHNADITARTDSDDTPLHVAAQYDQLQVVITLVHEFNCDINVKGHLGRSLLHSACASSGSHGTVVMYIISKYLSPLLVDNDGNTPLHTACSVNGSMPLLKSLLKYNPPMLMRNVHGQTPLDMATLEGRGVLDQYMVQNKGKILADYSNIQTLAKRKYSSAETITRIFVVGNPGAGKSSLIETLKREGFLGSLRRVSESSVPLHTAGIVPSIHTSKHYGRSLFYDFAGHPEYYSSHAAILENLMSSKKDGNIFIIVVDLREESIKIREILYYWFMFIQHQNFNWKDPCLIIVGSHLDIIDKEKVEDRRVELLKFYNEMHGVLHKVTYFMLDCRRPRSKPVGDIQKYIASYTRNLPQYTLSLYASTLLGLLEKDFSNEPAFSVAQLQSHIEVTHIALPRDMQSLHSLLLELHDIGLLFIINDVDSNKKHFHVIFNISILTNVMHKLLFSAEAKLRLRERCVESENSSFNIGIIPRNVLEAILPENIPKECLVQLQYCQQISHKDVEAFPSLTPSYPDQSLLFFPAFCSVDKSEVSWVTPPSNFSYTYSTGLLAQCNDPHDYFPSRFLHVLLLRLVFRFTLSVPAQNQPLGASPDHSHFQRLCTMWKTGVRWLMEEEVECMVELVKGRKRLVVITKSKEDTTENCISIFNRVISCVMEAKLEFCHSIKLQFFLLDSTDGAVGYLSKDHQFAMSEVEEALAYSEGKHWIMSVSGRRRMDISKLYYMCMFTQWVNLFPIEFKSILDYLVDIVSDLYDLGLYLGIPLGVLSTIEANFPTDIDRRRREIVRKWMSSTEGPPCWWHLVEALERLNYGVLVKHIHNEHGKSFATSMQVSMYLYFNRCCHATAKETTGAM